MLLPEQPRLREMAEYIKDLSPRNSVYFAKVFKNRQQGTIFIGISPRVNDNSFKDTLKYNLEHRGWQVQYSENGKVGVVSKGVCRFYLYFYSTKLYRFIISPDKITAIPV